MKNKRFRFPGWSIVALMFSVFLLTAGNNAFANFSPDAQNNVSETGEAFFDVPGDPIVIVPPEDPGLLQPMPLVFNMDTTGIDWTGYTLYQFEGAGLTRIENPDKTGLNETNYALEYTKSAEGQPWGGFFYHLATVVNTTSESVFRLKVWSPRDGIRGLMKLETVDGASTTGDLFADITVSEEWTLLEWDLSAVNQTINWDMVVVIMDLDTNNPPQGGARDTWYLDDFELTGVVSVDEPVDPGTDLTKLPLPLDLEDDRYDYDAAFTGFGGAEITRIENPQPDDVNNSSWVARYVKNDGAPWAGGYFDVQTPFVFEQDDAIMTMKVWSPRADISVSLKVERFDEEGALAGLREEATTLETANEWVELSWDFSAAGYTDAWSRVVVFFDWGAGEGQVGDGSADFTFFFDDITAGAPVEPVDPVDPGTGLVRVSLPIDFEDQTVNWDNVFLGFEGAHADVVPNPDKTEANDSDYVGRMIKNATIYWAGAFLLTDETFYFDSENNTITMDVWSPRTNVGIQIKVEQSDGTAEHGAFAVTSTSNEWEALTWDMSGASPLVDWDQITLFFDFHVGQNGDGGPDWTWYFDNLVVNAGDPDGERPEGPATPADLHPVSLPLDFEDDEFNWNFAFFGFEGGHANRVANPDQGEGNDSDYVGRMVKGSGPFWAGAFMYTDETFTIDSETPYISMKVWSPRADVPVLMKIEQQNGTLEYEITQNTTTSGEWEVMTWNMSAAGFTDAWDVVVMIFDFREGGVGDGGENFTWYFDDLAVNSDGMPTSITDPETGMPLAFELEQNYPNPFNPTTQIRFNLPEQSDVRLEVYNITGQLVSVLASGAYQPGQHTVSFDAANLASGMYIYRLHTASFTQTRKMMLLK